MKPILKLLSIILLTLLLSCNKEKIMQNPVQKEIDFTTDKSEYHDLVDIAIRFQNNTSSYLWVNWCRLYYLERFENGKWENMGGPPCPGGSSIQIEPHSVIMDTMYSNWLDKGKYRLATYDLWIDTAYTTVYSNEFDITDFDNFVH